MDFEYSDRTKALVEKLHKFMDEVIYPAEPVYEEQMEKAKDRWQLPPIIESLTGIKFEKLLEQVPSLRGAITPTITGIKEKEGL